MQQDLRTRLLVHNMINNTIKWNTKFSTYYVENLGYIFLSEDNFFKVDKSTYEEINNAIKKDWKDSDYIFSDDDFFLQMKRLESLQKLRENHLLGLASENYTPTEQSEVSYTSLVIGNTTYYFCKSVISEQHVYEIAKFIHLSSEQIEILIAHDYSSIKVESLKQLIQKDLLVVKPFGEVPIVGPLLQANSQPCLNCLKESVLENTPVIKLIKERLHVTPSFPTFFNFNKIQKVSTKANEILTHKIYNSLFEVNKVGYTEHFLHSHRECCANLQQTDMKIILGEPTLDEDDDGGYRAWSRTDTINAIKPFISPITGLINDISCISDSDSLYIYRTSYFKSISSIYELDEDSFVELGLGKGFSNDQSMCSALGEALERKLGQYTRTVKSLYSSPNELCSRYYLPHQLAQFSETQYNHFKISEGKSLQFPQWVRQYSSDIRINWTKSWSLTNEETVYFPTAFCFANTPFEDAKYSMYCHNGNASGSSYEEAILQGLFELIERDSVAIWWYNKIPRPAIDLSILDEKELEVIDGAIAQHWKYWVLDVTNDIGITSCVAVAENKSTKELLLGFGSHIEEKIATLRSLTELYQLITIKDKVTGPFDFKKIKNAPYLYPATNQTVPTKLKKPKSLKGIINMLVKNLKEKDIEVCVVNYSDSSSPLKTVKVIAPGLCHFWPRYSNSRLFEVPIKQKWLAEKLTEFELNKLELYL